MASLDVFFLCRSSKSKKMKNTNENTDELNLTIHNGYKYKKNIENENENENNCKKCELFSFLNSISFNNIFCYKQNDIEGKIVINDKKEKDISNLFNF